ncbi:alpha/beta fold hydrolase [Variovorax sp. PBL-E5]|uniref:alpha/beta fold hydrolase n=1 Tax=Variovorax sp. PBL-E5 TaxID=434014 RepID=UPI0013183F53|nr:alpha/beta hydrolase [Variovorax sp. PBL-E5]VTU18017.1 3-oxoadipate enol-lactonase [Variovorax sp. PBL-E5]
MAAAPAACAVHERRRKLLDTGCATIDVVIDTAAPGPRPAIVLLPSSLRDSLDFDPLARGLACAGFQVLRPQPRGMARSHGPMGGLDLAALAQDVVHTIDTFGDGRAVIMGHAFGHFVARVADLLYPDKVRGVVLAAAAARTFPAGMAEALVIASDPAQPDALRLRQLQHAFFAPGNDPSPWLSGWYPALREIYRAAGSTPPKAAWWPVTHAPLLDLQGAQDPWRPPESREELRQALGRDRVEVRLVPDASHALPVEQPERAAAAIAEWAHALAP